MANDVFYFILGWPRGCDNEDAILGRFPDLTDKTAQKMGRALHQEAGGNVPYISSLCESDIDEEETKKLFRAKAEIMAQRVAQVAPSDVKPPIEIRIAQVAHALYRQYEGRGPYGHRQWMHDGRIIEKKARAKVFQLACYLYENLDRQRSMDDVIGPGRMFEDGEKVYAAVLRTCSDITKYFRESKVPLKASASEKDRTMILMTDEDEKAMASEE